MRHRRFKIVHSGFVSFKPKVSPVELRLSTGSTLATFQLCSSVQTGRLERGGKARFKENLDKVVRGVFSSEKIVITSDFNEHIRVLPGGYNDMHGGFIFSDRNGEEAALLDFARAFRLVLVNSSFSKKEDYLITFRSAIAKTQIGFLLLRTGDRMLCKDYKVILSEHLSDQHRLLVMNFSIKKSKKK
ncbi:uncharacterized protein LOC124891416 [Capsicum annuum]|uniref:uncharacterized protein LOC124891416 n=1 Tax=Capsicum annuum TaxID=4072 RepID=UPI001FB09505|nr:uncharacterized protein LOC124891416 [Capsicum annuum]